MPSTNDLKIVIGDFNAKVGRESIYSEHIGKHSLHGKRSDNGVRLKNFAAGNNLYIGSTEFPHKNIHKATWRSPDGRYENPIDHTLIDKKHLSSLTL
jgi:hypothetical protein